MLALETVVKIRNDHFRDKVPIKAIARKRRVSRNTVRDGPEAFGSAGKRQPKQGLGSGSMIERSRSGRKTLPAELGSQPNRLIKRLSEGGQVLPFRLVAAARRRPKCRTWKPACVVGDGASFEVCRVDNTRATAPQKAFSLPIR